MLSKVILLVMLANLLTALPASETGSVLKTCVDVTSAAPTTTTTTAAPGSAEEACANATATTMFPKEDDPTCATYVYCYFSSGKPTALIKTCKTNTYFDSTLRLCSSTKPDNCT